MTCKIKDLLSQFFKALLIPLSFSQVQNHSRHFPLSMGFYGTVRKRVAPRDGLRSLYVAVQSQYEMSRHR